MINERFDRNIRFFGEEGQRRIRESTCALIGVGGLGTHIAQQLALLGVGKMYFVDSEELDSTNRNRYVGAWYDDPIPGLPKVDIGKRLASRIDPSISVELAPESFISAKGFAAIRAADYVFGCLDCEGARLILTEVCSAYARPYFDSPPTLSLVTRCSTAAGSARPLQARAVSCVVMSSIWKKQAVILKGRMSSETVMRSMELIGACLGGLAHQSCQSTVSWHRSRSRNSWRPLPAYEHRTDI